MILFHFFLILASWFINDQNEPFKTLRGCGIIVERGNERTQDKSSVCVSICRPLSLHISLLLLFCREPRIFIIIVTCFSPAIQFSTSRRPWRYVSDLIMAQPKPTSPALGLGAIRGLSTALLTSSKEQRRVVTPAILADIHGEMTLSIAPNRSDIIDPPVLAALFDALSNALQNLQFSSSGGETHDFHAVFERRVTDALLVVLMALDILKKHADKEQADDEDIITNSFLCVHSFASSLNAMGITATPRVFSGPFLAQTVQCALHFASHRSRGAAATALRALVALLRVRCLQHPLAWRGFFPGMFSGLFVCCSAGYKR
jgi:hypothetical protein